MVTRGSVAGVRAVPVDPAGRRSTHGSLTPHYYMHPCIVFFRFSFQYTQSVPKTHFGSRSRLAVISYACHSARISALTQSGTYWSDRLKPSARALTVVTRGRWNSIMAGWGSVFMIGGKPSLFELLIYAHDIASIKDWTVEMGVLEASVVQWKEGL